MAINVQADLTFEITNQCNFRCQMCTIWKEKNHVFWSPEKLVETVLKAKKTYGSLESVSLTGGECFMHPQIETILVSLSALQRRGIICSFDLVSNGWFLRKMSKIIEKHHTILNTPAFTFSFSVDGMQQKHEEQRGMPGSFQRILQGVDLLKKNLPQATICFKFTATNVNASDMLKLHEFTREIDVAYAPKIAEFDLGQYYHRLEGAVVQKQHTNTVREQLKQDFSQLVEGETHCDKRPLREIIHFLRTGEFRKGPCYTPLRSLFFDAWGKIYPCLYHEPIGTVDGAWEQTILSSNHKKIIDSGCKRSCKGCLAYHGFLKDFNYPKTASQEPVQKTA